MFFMFLLEMIIVMCTIPLKQATAIQDRLTRPQPDDTLGNSTVVYAMKSTHCKIYTRLNASYFMVYYLNTYCFRFAYKYSKNKTIIHRLARCVCIILHYFIFVRLWDDPRACPPRSLSLRLLSLSKHRPTIPEPLCGPWACLSTVPEPVEGKTAEPVKGTRR